MSGKKATISTLAPLWPSRRSGSCSTETIRTHLPTESLELQSAREVGLDLDAVEGLGRLIEPGTCALLVLVELRWASDLLAAVLGSDGFPVISGCLEPETMLVIGLKLAAAVRSVAADERTTALRGAAMLDALASTRMASTTAADVIQPLIAAGLLERRRCRGRHRRARAGRPGPPIIARRRAQPGQRHRR